MTSVRAKMLINAKIMAKNQNPRCHSSSVYVVLIFVLTNKFDLI